MKDELWQAIDAHLATVREQLAGRRRFQRAMDTAHAEKELWDALRPFLRSADDYRDAAAFMAAWLRRRTRA